MGLSQSDLIKALPATGAALGFCVKDGRRASGRNFYCLFYFFGNTFSGIISFSISQMKPACYATFLLTLSALPSLSQTPLPATDTAGYVKGGYHKFTDTFRLGELTKADGTKLTAYLPCTRMGYERILDYFETPPGQKPHAERHTLPMKQVYTMRVHGQYYENLGDNGKPADVMALRVLAGPTDVFTYAQPKMLPVPIPGATVLLVNAYTNNHWYLRRSGEVTELRRGKFAEQLSAYIADYPELARRVASGEANYGYQNTLAIMNEYNEYLTKAGK